MARSLSLATLRALRRGPARSAQPGPDRPSGRLIWIHCADRENLPALAGLAPTLRRELDSNLLITLSNPPADGPPGLFLREVPADHTQAARAFLDHWRPDLLMWSGGAFRPVLIAETDDRPMGRILIDAREDRVWVEGGGWLPGLTRSILDRFSQALAMDADAAQRLRRAGMTADRIHVAGPLIPPHPVPSCNERDRADLAQSLGPRPIWLAAQVPMDELGDILIAAQIALQRAHRLLLILTPAQPADGPAMADAVRAAGLSVAVRSDGGEPLPDAEVYLADQAGELGLWYRLSPLTYLGGTLRGSGTVVHPHDPAVLGSVVIHGPRAPVAAMQLGAVGGARAVRDADDLGRAVEMLLSPDRAALMAHAAWLATTAGADAANRITAAAAQALPRVTA